MGMTISTHNGTAAHRGHNIRLESVVSKQDHIVPGGNFEIWHDEAPREAYERIFGEYVKEYNEGQKRPERRIKNYYDSVCKDAKKNPVYEMIVAIGNKDHSPSNADCRQILYEFIHGNEDVGFSSWAERNPNLELVGAYYHADEQGVPHLHVDYVPIAYGYKRGMWAQNGLDRALRDMGYEHEGRHATPQIKWQNAQNKHLEELCRWHGIEVEHPMADKGVQHVHTELYKARAEYRAEIDDMESTKSDMEDLAAHIQDCITDTSATLQRLLEQEERLKENIKEKAQTLDNLDKQIDKARELLDNDFNRLSKQYKERYEAEHARILIKADDLLRNNRQSHDYGQER